MNEYIPVVTKQYSCKIRVEDIIYIQQQQRRLAIVTDDETYLYYEKIENVSSHLSRNFFSVMHKLTVNLDKITLIRDGRIHFQNGEELYLGKENYVKVKQRYTAHILGLYRSGP